MSLTKAEKVNILMGLSDAHKEKMAKAILNAEKTGMTGSGIMDTIKGLGKGLLEILKVVGPTLAKEVLLPIVKAKLAGSGLRLAGQRGKGKKGGSMPVAPIPTFPGAGTSLAGGGPKLAGGCCDGFAPSTGAPVTIKRGRGRPKKHPVM